MGRHGRLIVVLLFLGLLYAAFELSGLREQFSLQLLQLRLQQHLLGGLLLFTLLFALGNLVQIPGWLFLAAAVLTLGRGMGGLATYFAASVSCIITFMLVRAIGGDALRQLDNRLAKRLFHQMDTYPVASIALLRVLFQTVPALNYALALSGVKFRHYLAGTLLGLPLPIFLYCLFFDYLAMALNIR